jgi:glucan phosphoethanolaminetransferase (alkaline phosphatase superfamily)
MGKFSQLEGSIVMNKKRVSFLAIFLFLAVNIISLSRVIEGYYGREYDHVFTFMIIALLSTALATIAFFVWKRAEYKN